MRTTVTLDPDADAIVRRLMRDRGLTFKQALNAVIRSGAASPGKPHTAATPIFDMGDTTMPIDKALRLAADLEDEEQVRKLALRK